MFNQTVPNWLVGVWKRLSIEENGHRDTTTQVTWIQTKSGFADIRIPTSQFVFRPIVRYSPSKTSQLIDLSLDNAFASLSPQQAKALSQQEGFAGITQFNNGLCEWQRALDYSPFTGEPDQGTLHWEGDVLVEVGTNGAYKEEWQKIASGPTATMTSTKKGVWEKWLVICGDYFIYMCDRRQHLPANTTLENLLGFNADGTLDLESRQYLSCEVSLGRISAGSKDWEIQQSTLPWKKGDRLWNPEEVLLNFNNNRAIQTIGNSQVLWDIQEYGNLKQLFQPSTVPCA